MHGGEAFRWLMLAAALLWLLVIVAITARRPRAAAPPERRPIRPPFRLSIFEALDIIQAFLDREPAVVFEHERDRLERTMLALVPLDSVDLLEVCDTLGILQGARTYFPLRECLRDWLLRERWARLQPRRRRAA